MLGLNTPMRRSKKKLLVVGSSSAQEENSAQGNIREINVEELNDIFKNDASQRMTNELIGKVITNNLTIY